MNMANESPDTGDFNKRELLNQLWDLHQKLDQHALQSAWITPTQKGNKVYYRLRWISEKRECERRITAGQVAAYQRMIELGKITKSLEELARALEEFG